MLSSAEEKEDNEAGEEEEMTPEIQVKVRSGQVRMGYNRTDFIYSMVSSKPLDMQ